MICYDFIFHFADFTSDIGKTCKKMIIINITVTFTSNFWLPSMLVFFCPGLEDGLELQGVITSTMHLDAMHMEKSEKAITATG
jgi:hypothetical protein